MIGIDLQNQNEIFQAINQIRLQMNSNFFMIAAI